MGESSEKDIISFDNMLEMGVKVIFAKDGTDAMDPALYLTEEENAVIGEWAAESVEELLETDLRLLWKE